MVFSILEKSSLLFGSKKICVTQYLSRRSINSIPHKFLDLFIHHDNITLSQLFFAVSSPQVCVRNINFLFIKIKII
ncbi:MAG: hypothetical protein WCG25_02205 [bacterium]